jgi:hypothetical protein
MSAPIIRHGNWVDNYDDPHHPIPSTTALDVHGIRKGGGSDLIIIVAAPLGGDERSQQRLLAKIENYLRYIRSPEYLQECGPPGRDRTCIVVRLHPESDPLILDLLQRCEPWVATNLSDLKVVPLNEAFPASSNNRSRGP